MGTRAFIDTNVLVYLYDSADSHKRNRARELLLDDSFDLVISSQVLSEFYVTVTRKIAAPLSPEAAGLAVEALGELEVVPLTRNLVIDAIATGTQHGLSHWDAMIVEAASRSGTDTLVTDTLFTEDLATGSTIRGVEIVNPFSL